MRTIHARAKAPMYITVDTGHAIGQRAFLRPEDAADGKDYLYSGEKDTDIYNWLRELGRFSPIIHLQQTDGNTSSHRPFTSRWNEGGIIFPEKVLAGWERV